MVGRKKKIETPKEVLENQIDGRTSRHLGAKVKRAKWEKLAAESIIAYKMFEYFLHSSNRNLAETAQEFKMDMEFTSDLYNRYAWEARALAYDHDKLNEEVGLEVLQPGEVTAKTTKERHIKMAELGEAVVAKGLFLWDRYLNECTIADNNGIDRPKAPPITPEQIVRMSDSYTKLKRLTIGEATSISENRTVDLKKLDNSTLEKLLEAARKDIKDED